MITPPPIDAQNDNGTPSPNKKIKDDDNNGDDNDDFLGGLSTLATLPPMHPKPLPKWVIFTIIDLVKFLGDSSLLEFCIITKLSFI